MRKNYTTSQRVMSVYLLWRVYTVLCLWPLCMHAWQHVCGACRPRVAGCALRALPLP